MANKDKNNDEQSDYTFKPRARLLQLLGDQLIGTPRLAVFELVKNAYDADASAVTVKLLDLDSPKARIVVEDDGEGMSLNTIKDFWLVPGDDHREKQRDIGKRTTKGRLPLGEKGLGRFAAHKLGDKIEIVTKAKGSAECVVSIDWTALLKKKFLSDAIVDVSTRQAEEFKGRMTGTRIIISKLRGKPWTRGEIRRLSRQINSVSSPASPTILSSKKEKFPIEDFKATLEVPSQEEWLKGIPTVDDILNLAFWHCQFRIENGKLSWGYEFKKVPELKLEGQKIKKLKDDFEIVLPHQEDEEGKVRRAKRVQATKEMQKNIGPIWGEFYVFDRDNPTIAQVPALKKAAEYLNVHGGVRVYRDGVRVYNYGETEDDWLSLDLKRLNDPTRRWSNNITVGSVNVLLEKSFKGLIEKSNREGFVENEEYAMFSSLVSGAIDKFAPEYFKDKDRIRRITKQKADVSVEKIKRPLDELRKVAAKKKVLKDFEKIIAKIEGDYDDMRQAIMQSGMSNLSLALVFHEVVRGVKALAYSASSGASIKDLKEQADHLDKLLDDITDLLRSDAPKKQSIAKVVRQARRFYQGRLVFHKVRFESELIDSDDDDFEATFSFGMILNSLTNVIDNSIYWLQSRWPDEESSKAIKRKLFIGVSYDVGDGPALVIADNGAGFESRDTPEDLIRCFFSRKIIEGGKRGTGLGLYYTNMALELNNAKLIFTTAKDVGIPKDYDGAVVAFLFEDEE